MDTWACAWRAFGSRQATASWPSPVRVKKRLNWQNLGSNRSSGIGSMIPGFCRPSIPAHRNWPQCWWPSRMLRWQTCPPHKRIGLDCPTWIDGYPKLQVLVRRDGSTFRRPECLQTRLGAKTFGSMNSPQSDLVGQVPSQPSKPSAGSKVRASSMWSCVLRAFMDRRESPMSNRCERARPWPSIRRVT